MGFKIITPMPEELVSKIDDYARKTDRSRSASVRFIIKTFLEGEGNGLERIH